MRPSVVNGGFVVYLTSQWPMWSPSEVLTSDMVANKLCFLQLTFVGLRRRVGWLLGLCETDSDERLGLFQMSWNHCRRPRKAGMWRQVFAMSSLRMTWYLYSVSSSRVGGRHAVRWRFKNARTREILGSTQLLAGMRLVSPTCHGKQQPTRTHQCANQRCGDVQTPSGHSGSEAVAQTTHPLPVFLRAGSVHEVCHRDARLANTLVSHDAKE